MLIFDRSIKDVIRSKYFISPARLFLYSLFSLPLFSPALADPVNPHAEAVQIHETGGLGGAIKTNSISKVELEWIGQRIYQNECAAKPENLIHWGEGEAFPSLGIGHFIWYPSGVSEKYHEMFPQMVAYVSQYEPAPEWLQQLKPFDAPWASKQLLQSELKTDELIALRNWLLTTKGLQSEFIAQQLTLRFNRYPFENTEQTVRIQNLYNRLLSFKTGRFALIDYVNFKGVGDKSEQYQGQGWGLVSVLEDMLEWHASEILLLQMSEAQLLQMFIDSAKRRLELRVKLAPAERGEQRWLRGWFKRLDSYLLL